MKGSDKGDMTSEEISITFKKLQDHMLDELVGLTYGFVGADLESLCKEAAMTVIRRVLPDVNLKDEQTLPKEALEKLIISRI
ncbi:MAG: hypothetical protein IH795_12040, partial [Bacteroidetes bacterium]|nr:hypothetical protein [Bacteroidota bacterium]